MELVENKEPCIECSAVFMREKKRGRPPSRCQGCRDKLEAAQVEAVSLQDPDTVYSGPVEKLKGSRSDLPQGCEAQCPLCWRIFTSDSSCEAHKIYPRDDSPILCVNPTTVGMVPRERRGLPVWTRPSDRIFV